MQCKGVSLQLQKVWQNKTEEGVLLILTPDTWKRVERRMCDVCQGLYQAKTDRETAKRPHTAQCPQVDAQTPMKVEAASAKEMDSGMNAEHYGPTCFQQQTGSECGMTALNNALQEARFTAESMQEAADGYT